MSFPRRRESSNLSQRPGPLPAQRGLRPQPNQGRAERNEKKRKKGRGGLARVLCFFASSFVFFGSILFAFFGPSCPKNKRLRLGRAGGDVLPALGRNSLDDATHLSLSRLIRFNSHLPRCGWAAPCRAGGGRRSPACGADRRRRPCRDRRRGSRASRNPFRP